MLLSEKGARRTFSSCYERHQRTKDEGLRSGRFRLLFWWSVVGGITGEDHEESKENEGHEGFFGFGVPVVGSHNRLLTAVCYNDSYGK